MSISGNLKGSVEIYVSRMFFALALILLLNAVGFCDQPVERVLPMDESIHLAVSNSQQMLEVQLDIKIAQQRLREAKSGMYPQLEMNTNFSRFEAESPLLTSNILGNTILPQKLPAEIANNISNIENYYTAKISLFQVLWSAGKLSAMKQYAQTELMTAEGNYEIIKSRTKADVKKSYYRLLAIKKKIEIYNQVLNELNAIKFETVNTAERVIYWEKLKGIESGSAEVKMDWDTARIDFLDTIGLELDTVFTVVGDLEFKKTEADLNKCLAWAVEYRPELKKLELQEQMDALQVSLSLSGRYPTVSVGGIYQLEDTKLPFEKKSWNATVNVTIPFFDGFATYARIRQKKYQYRKAQIYKASVLDGLKAEVRKLFIKYRFAGDNLDARQKDVETISEKDITAAAGKMPAVEFIQFHEAMLNTRIRYVDALENAIITKIELENSVGRNIE